MHHVWHWTAKKIHIKICNSLGISNFLKKIGEKTARTTTKLLSSNGIKAFPCFSTMPMLKTEIWITAGKLKNERKLHRKTVILSACFYLGSVSLSFRENFPQPLLRFFLFLQIIFYWENKTFWIKDFTVLQA